MTIDSSMIQFKDRANADSSVYPISIQKAIVDKPDGDDLTTYITEYNISLHQRNTTAGVGTPRRDTSIFTLNEAIAQVPDEYKHGGLKLTFNSSNRNDSSVFDNIRSYVLDSSVWNTNTKMWYEEGNNALVGYYTCTSGANQNKVVNDASGYVLSLGGSMKIKFTTKNTLVNPTLNINGQGAKSIIYDGSTCSSTNTWADGETVEAYYDGSVYQLNNVAGGGTFKTGEKIKDVGIDDEPVSNSDNIVKSDGIFDSFFIGNFDKHLLIDSIQSIVGFISGVTDKWVTAGNFAYKLAPIDSSTNYLIQNNNDTIIYYALLTSNNHTTGTTPDYADGCTREEIQAFQSKSIFSVNASYLFISTIVNYISVNPSIMYGRHDIRDVDTTPIDDSNNLVTSGGVKQCVNDVRKLTIPNSDIDFWYEGYKFNYENATPVSFAGFKISNAIPLKKGLSIYTSSTGNNFSTIILTDASLSFRTPLVRVGNMEDSSINRLSSYTATNDCYVQACVDTTTGSSYVETESTLEELSELKVNLNNEINSTKIQTYSDINFEFGGINYETGALFDSNEIIRTTDFIQIDKNNNIEIVLSSSKYTYPNPVRIIKYLDGVYAGYELLSPEGRPYRIPYAIIKDDSFNQIKICVSYYGYSISRNSVGVSRVNFESTLYSSKEYDELLRTNIDSVGLKSNVPFRAIGFNTNTGELLDSDRMATTDLIPIKGSFSIKDFNISENIGELVAIYLMFYNNGTFINSLDITTNPYQTINLNESITQVRVRITSAVGVSISFNDAFASNITYTTGVAYKKIESNSIEDVNLNYVSSIQQTLNVLKFNEIEMIPNTGSFLSSLNGNLYFSYNGQKYLISMTPVS